MEKKNVNEKKPAQSANKKRNALVIALSVLLVLIILLRIVCAPQVEETADTPETPQDTAQVVDTLPLDTASKIIAPLDTQTTVVPPPPRVRRDTTIVTVVDTTPARDSVKVDTTAMATIDTLEAHLDTTTIITDECARDTLALRVFADPSAGLHRAPVSVKLVANKNAVIEWSTDDVNWKIYNANETIDISTRTTLYFRAEDDCGRKMGTRIRQYEFDNVDRSAQCPPDMQHIISGDKEFCIDTYEWPNRRNVTPTSFVSQYHAMDSCFSVRKRLCTSDEWTMACAGPSNTRYPYGNEYDGDACVTRDSHARRSGANPECRAYFGVFDMSGNLAEWTSTPAPQDRSFSNVMGGFWASGAQSGCALARYSYFPQNKHNPVGFRCCRDALPLVPQGRRGR